MRSVYGQPKAKTEIYFRHCCYDSGPNSSLFMFYHRASKKCFIEIFKRYNYSPGISKFAATKMADSAELLAGNGEVKVNDVFSLFVRLTFGVGNTGFSS